MSTLCSQVGGDKVREKGILKKNAVCAFYACGIDYVTSGVCEKVGKPCIINVRFMRLIAVSARIGERSAK